LINTEHLQVANSTNIARFFKDTVNMLTPHVIDRNDILLIITNAAPYMIKSVKALNVLYPRMMHLTCLNRVCEEIRSLFPNVDLLIYNEKKVFSKFTHRNAIFKQFAPNVQIPPKPVITRWRTWLTAANYYAAYFDEFKNVMNELNLKEYVRTYLNHTKLEIISPL